jgi:hypothetical protein
MPYDIATLALVTPVFKTVWAEALARGLATDRDESARVLIASTLAAAVDRNGERDPARLTELAMQAVIGRAEERSPQRHVVH